MFLVRLILVFSVVAGTAYCTVAFSCNDSQPGLEVMAQSIREIKQQQEEQWLKKPGVVSVGIGLDADKKPAIIIGVTRVTAALQSEFPERIAGYSIVLKGIGELHAQDK